MIRHFIRKEIIETLLGPKFAVTFIISLVLILVSVMHGYQLFTIERAWHANAIAQNKERLANLGSYGVMLQQGSKSLREPDSLSIFARGVDSAIGRSAMVTDDPNLVVRDSRYGLNPIFAVFGELDLAFIVKFILSLFALLFSYNAISGERETGTLKVVFSNSVSRASYILGKGIGGLVPLLLTLILPTLIALLALMLLFGADFSGEEWLRISLLIGSFALYLTMFFTVGLLASALSRSSMISFLLCLFFWVMSVVLLPKLAVEVAGYISPAPSIDELEVKRTALRKEYYTRVRSLIEERVTADVADDGNVNTTPIRRQAEAEVQEQLADQERQLIDEYRRQQLRLLHSATNLARVSPTSSLTFAVNRLARTDAELRERFLDSLRRYRNEYIKFADSKLLANPDKSSRGIGISVSVDEDESGNMRYRVGVSAPLSEIDVGDLPNFSLARENVETSLAAALPDLGLLAAELLVTFALAFVVFTRYDVR